MPRGALFGQKENFTVCFSGKRRSLLHLNTAQRSFFPLQSFSRKTSRKYWLEKSVYYSYFEKSCRKKCTRQCRKVLQVVLSSLFFKEICKNGTRGHGLMFIIAKGKKQQQVRQLQCQEQVITHIPIAVYMYTERLYRIVLMPAGHPIILLKSNKFNMAAVSVKRSCPYPHSKQNAIKFQFPGRFYAGTNWKTILDRDSAHT